MTLVLAHLGHWYVGLPVYGGPVVLLIAWVKLGEWREKRQRRRQRPDGRSKGSGR